MFLVKEVVTDSPSSASKKFNDPSHLENLMTVIISYVVGQGHIIIWIPKFSFFFVVVVSLFFCCKCFLMFFVPNSNIQDWFHLIFMFEHSE